MMTLSLLLKTYAALLWPVHRPIALGCWAFSLGADVVWVRRSTRHLPHPRRACAVDTILANLGAAVVAVAVHATVFQAALRFKDGLPWAAGAGAFLFRTLQFNAGAFDGTFYATTMAGPLAFPVNLDNLGALVPLLFLGMAAVYLMLAATAWKDLLKGVLAAAATLLAAMLLRWVLGTGLFLALCDFIGYETDELPMAPFFKPLTIYLVYLPFLVWAAWFLHPRLVHLTAPVPSERRGINPGRWWLWLVIAFLLLAVWWEPAGAPKGGEVLINTFHTRWSRTDRPYDREWYGADSGYNYACLKRLYEGFYDVRELTGRLSAQELANASVLVVFDPDRAFTEEEIRAVRAFVQRGGGLMLIGDHTNVFGSSSHLNQLAEHFGFLYRDDVLFDIDEDFFQLLDVEPPATAFLHGMDFFKLRGPASIKSTSLFTRNVLTVGNAKSLRAIYSVNNFYPPPHDHPKMWTGDFTVSLAARHGRGRVLAFADSTIFSNFEIFYPGKYEFLLNGLHWLDHADAAMHLPLRRIGLALAVVLAGFLALRARHPRRLLGVVLTGLVLAGVTWLGARAAEQARGEFPAPKYPMRFLFFAAEPDDEPLTLRAFVTESPYDTKYDVFIQWVLRTGAFSGFHLCDPGAKNTFSRMLVEDDTVDAGYALIATTPEHLDLLASTGPGTIAPAGRVLLMFSSELSWDDVRRALVTSKVLASDTALAEAEAAWPNGEVRREDGERRVLLVFSAERFSDARMGVTEKVRPNETHLALYREQFALIDWLFGIEPVMVSEDEDAVEVEVEVEADGTGDQP